MKTTLPKSIKTVKEAKAFLTALHRHGESFHPEDDALTVIFDIKNPPNKTVRRRLNYLMSDIYDLPGNDGRHVEPMVFDPCEFLIILQHTSERYFVKDKSGRSGHYKATYSDLLEIAKEEDSDEFNDWINENEVGDEFTEFNNKTITRTS